MGGQRARRVFGNGESGERDPRRADPRAGPVLGVRDVPGRVRRDRFPAGANWTVTVNGIANGSSRSVIEFNEPNGTFSYLLASPVPWAPGTQFVATPAAGSFDLFGAAADVRISYQPEYELDASSASPGGGFVNPSGGWYLSGAAVNVSALAAPGELFVGWTGSGFGSYTGPANPALVTVDSPVTEEARFSPATTYAVTYSEMGLPPGTAWSVTTNGIRATSTMGSLVFNEPNGSYSYGAQTTYLASNGSAYAAVPGFGSFTVAGAAIHEAVEFAPVAPKASVPGTQAGASSPIEIPLGIFAAVLVALLIVIAILAYASRRPPDPPTVPTPITPPPRADWDESA